MDSQDSELNGDEKAKVSRRGQTTRGAVCSRDCGPELGEDDQQAEPKWKDPSQGCLRPSPGNSFQNLSRTLPWSSSKSNKAATG